VREFNWNKIVEWPNILKKKGSLSRLKKRPERVWLKGPRETIGEDMLFPKLRRSKVGTVYSKPRVKGAAWQPSLSIRWYPCPVKSLRWSRGTRPVHHQSNYNGGTTSRKVPLLESTMSGTFLGLTLRWVEGGLSSWLTSQER